MTTRVLVINWLVPDLLGHATIAAPPMTILVAVGMRIMISFGVGTDGTLPVTCVPLTLSLSLAYEGSTSECARRPRRIARTLAGVRGAWLAGYAT